VKCTAAETVTCYYW